MCVKVTYADGMEDLIEANEYHGERHQNKEVYKGRLASTNGKAVVILNPNPEGKDLVVFKCAKVAGCTKFRVDLEVKIFCGNTKDVMLWFYPLRRKAKKTRSKNFDLLQSLTFLREQGRLSVLVDQTGSKTLSMMKLLLTQRGLTKSLTT